MDSGVILSPNVKHPGLWVPGSAAPVSAPVLARHRDLIPSIAHRSVDAFVAGGQQDLLQLLALSRFDVGIDVVDGHLLPRHGWWLGRDRLCWPGFLARHIALRERFFLDRPERLSGHTIEHEEETRFCPGDHNV